MPSLQVMNSLTAELSQSELSEEEILRKAKRMMKAFAKQEVDESTLDKLDMSLVSKQNNSALHKAAISPKDFVKVGDDINDG